VILLNKKSLRDIVKAATIHYSSGFDHYTIVWDAVHTAQNRHIGSKEYVREQLDFLRAKEAGIISSGTNPSGNALNAHRVFFARS